MRTTTKFSIAFISLFLLSACDKDEIGPVESPGGSAHYNKLTQSYTPETILTWNEALSQAVDNKMPQAAQTRIYAMVSLAVHDALNNIVPIYEHFALNNSTVDAREYSTQEVAQMADAAIAVAAHSILTALFPPSKENADLLLAGSLANIADSEFKTRGMAIGNEAALAIMVNRQNDIPLGFSSYTNGTIPGVHQVNYMPFAVANPPVWPEHAVYGANLGTFTPFALASADQFRPYPPYYVDSEEYLFDYNDVKILGCNTCSSRSPEQTEIGLFHKENPSGAINRIARQLISQKGLNGWRSARLLGLLHMAQMDANIASFEAKYYFNFWLPVTAIRLGDNDGNDQTNGDADWTPLFAPPPTPDYPSTPAAAIGASAEIFRQFFKTDNISFTTSNPFDSPGVERSFTSFTEYSLESALSRVYIGSHFRQSVLTGEGQGIQIGRYIFINSLRVIVRSS